MLSAVQDKTASYQIVSFLVQALLVDPIHPTPQLEETLLHFAWLRQYLRPQPVDNELIKKADNHRPTVCPVPEVAQTKL